MAEQKSGQTRYSRCDQVADQIQARIKSGLYPPGAYMPGERDLAADLGVSRATVAGALTRLAQKGLVLQTRGRGTRVLALSDRLATGLVGVVVRFKPTGVSREPANILAGIRSAMARLNLNHEEVLLLNGGQDESAGWQHSVPSGELQRLADRYGGLVFIESSPREAGQLLALQAQGIPVVVANMEWDWDAAISATRTDHRKAMFQAVRTLAALGHRRIGYVGRPRNRCFYGHSEDGWRDGLADAGLDVDPALLRHCGDSEAVGGFLAAWEMLALPHPPTAIVTARDLFAEGVCEAVKERGAVLGRDVSVVGFDDVSWPDGRAFLTTFREPCEEMGAAAVQMLADRIADPSLPAEDRVIEAKLVLRRSAGPPPGDGPGVDAGAVCAQIAAIEPPVR
ncbi:MAG TPA: GntR family transcriptional regulator [Candidatus Brocadiia bacterium]|nr:GntR family transcriptional regulator [Candidatus Brocadiia bacterium]